jgi:DNA-binding response OmpR family regulator
VDEAAIVGRRLVVAGMQPHLLGSAADLDVCLARTGCRMALIDAGLVGEGELALTRRLTTEWQAHVVRLTPEDNVAARVHAYESGAACVLERPIELEELVAVLVGLARRHGLAQLVPEPCPPTMATAFAPAARLWPTA